MSDASSNPTSPQSVDLRHMTSAAALAGTLKDPRSVNARNIVRLDSCSPSSIPSSPTSVKSSSSAIFERDIEPIVCPSPPHTSAHPLNPHRKPRSKATEQLEQSVPSVLDSAAEILTAAVPDEVSIMAPCLDTGRRSGFASPIGSLRSRSPSPLGMSPATHVKSLLLSIPSPSSPNHSTQLSPPSLHSSTSGNASPAQPAAITHSMVFTNLSDTPGSVTPPSIVTPTSAYFSVASSVGSSPKTTTLEHAQNSPPQHSSAGTVNIGTGASTLLNPSHPPSPTHSATKRLSFMSYSDLLSSTPASLVPLSSLTASATTDPPPHIPSVSSLAQATLPRVPLGGYARDSVVLDDMGGEWEREGLGRGLDECLEEVLMADVTRTE